MRTTRQNAHVARCEIRVGQRFNAPPGQVFDAWLDPGVAGNWLFATATHRMSRVNIEARAGGLFRFADGLNGTPAAQVGKYLEVARPRRLAFTLEDDRRRRHRRSHVVVDIVPLATGCKLTLTHSDVPQDEADDVEGRWAGMLYGLETLLARNMGRKRQA